MKKNVISIFLMFFTAVGLYAQNIVKGTVVNDGSGNGLKGVSISLKGTNNSKVTDEKGTFKLTDLPDGKQIIIISKNGYETQNYPVTLEGSEVDVKQIVLYIDESFEDQDMSTIVISDDELNDDTSAADNISGLLQASRDVYARTAAYEWSSSFYRIRGLDSDNGKILLNGIEMNKLYNGRAQWSNWGGLNDVLRNQEFSNGLAPSNFTFGGVLGSNNISTRASEYRKGGRFSYASSNRSYSSRLMGSYSSGLLESGWAFTVSGSRRWAEQGYSDGSLYDAYSMFASVEKKINNKHSINFTSIHAKNRRGKSAPHTQEAYDLKGIKYNEYWGFQSGKIRNSREKRVAEPIFMLNHYWNISNKATLQTNLSYQFGEIGNSRIDFNGGQDPRPIYYQKLPSYFLSKGNLLQAYQAEETFRNDGQLDWESLYMANINNKQLNKNASYVLYEDRNDDKQLSVNSILNMDVNDNIFLNGKLQYTKLKSENFANVLDLLGGSGYLDISKFSNIGTPGRQNNLLNPNRIVKKGDKFKYNYNIESSVMNAFLQGQFKYNKVDFYLAGDVSMASHQREGLYKNGRFSNSYGKSEKQEFMNFGGKAGVTYKISGRHLLDFNAGYLTKSPTIRNIFSNSRENNSVVKDLTSEKIMSFDASYVIRTPFVTSRLTGYYTGVQDATNIGFFYQEDSETFVQEITTGIGKQHIGAEFGIEVQATPTFKVKGAANIGQYTYNKNPNVYLSTENNVDATLNGFVNGTKDFGVSYLKDYHVAAGPQTALSLGFEYRDPKYWFMGITGNYLANTHINVSPITRSSAFYTDPVDGLPLPNYSTSVAKQLLKQEKFDNYFTLNAIGGKTWKVGDRKYIGFFASISNILDREYKTGGFEQARVANYNSLKEDKERSKRLFGSKYWYARGATYFLNINYRF